jgi:hypothetical protein
MNWEITGNPYICISRIARETGAIHSINVVHAGLDGLLEWCAAREPGADTPPFLLPTVRVDGEVAPLANVRFERVDRWIPRFTAAVLPDLTMTMTLCAPGGWQPLVRGALVRIELENKADANRTLEVSLEGHWQWSLLCIATARPLSSANRLVVAADGRVLALEAAHGGSGAALALAAAGEGVRVRVDADGSSEFVAEQGAALRFRIGRSLQVRSGRRASVTFTLGVAPERDGAIATARDLAARDANDLVHAGRLELARLTRKGAPRELSDALNRNIVFAYYCGLARGIDDDRLYPLASRATHHGACAIIDEAEVLDWLVPFLTRVDAFLARELLVRMLDAYSDRAGTGLRYLRGGVVAPSFALDALCAYTIAIDRYAEDANDPSMREEPVVQDVLREGDDFAWARLHRDVFLASTERMPSGDQATYPYVAWCNAVLWRFCRALERLWLARPDEPPPHLRGAADELAAAFWQHCTADHDGVRVIAGATDLNGNAAIYDDPEGSLRLLPRLGFCHEEDPLWTDTMELLHSPAYPLWLGDRSFPGLAGNTGRTSASFVALCADLLGPGRERALDTIRRMRLDGGVAGRAYDPDTGNIVSGAYDAHVAALLATNLLEVGTKEPARDKAARR